ncbi:siaz-interacting nuclear protein [Rhinichthys klamathensis goyatoka]|uniref:siaz-interacting nuclear protein n=1 Tax=Rhinichthys klamathensis goyatoka TaxID=3034132 RepID=UPI0024B58860|nr:siaz-interacting nuclear protein [Rhinichthys klamathensis goyatoka]
MGQHNAEPETVTQSLSDTTSDKRRTDVFKRRKPLTFSPKRQYGLAVISPLQKHDSREIDGSSSGTSSPAHSNNILEEITFEIPRRARRRSLTSFRPFSFDARDSAQRVERERRLREMRQMQEQLWSSNFKAHPVRRYKPLIQPKDRSRPV